MLMSRQNIMDTIGLNHLLNFTGKNYNSLLFVKTFEAKQQKFKTLKFLWAKERADFVGLGSQT